MLMQLNCPQWSIGIITYTLLCGFTPFRAEDREELVKETTRAKVEFPARYWKHVSQEAKNFVTSLIQSDPKKRPTAEEALASTVRCVRFGCSVPRSYTMR